MKRCGKIIKLTSGGKERSFIFTDDDTLLFPATRGSDSTKGITTDFYKISLTGGEAVKAFTFPIPVTKLIPLSSGDFIVLGKTFPDFEDLYTGDTELKEKYEKYLKDNEDYEVIDKFPWWSNGSTFSRGAYTSLFYYSVSENTLTRLTDVNFSATNPKLSPDEKSVFFQGGAVKAISHGFENMSLYKLDIESGEQKLVAQSGKDFIVKGFEFGDSFILIAAADGHIGSNTDPDFYKLTYDTLEITPYVKYGYSLSSTIGSDIRYGGGNTIKMVGDTCYFISTRFDSAYLFKLEKGEISPVTTKEGSVDSFDVHGDRIILTALYDMKGQELYDEKGTQLTSFNDDVLSGKYVAIPEKLNFTRDGTEIHGFVLKPFGFEKGGKYPVVIDIHGGPKTAFGPVYYHEMQYWANLGYFVIYCNPTGSDGRGDFSDIRGKYGTVDYDDIMAFCDEALKAYPEMDEENFFETGGSYGGFMTNWIIGHTDRFKACASQRSISNWFSFYGISDIGVRFSKDQNASTPWEDPEKLWFHSPMKYADNVKTPTLFIHSFEDYRCPIDQGYQMFTSLVDHGVEAKMVTFKGENHELSRSGKPTHRIRRIDEITKWFEEHRG
jgi:dipeptidyl aminopeptidase/acylaminoacyl peptidase